MPSRNKLYWPIEATDRVPWFALRHISHVKFLFYVLFYRAVHPCRCAVRSNSARQQQQKCFPPAYSQCLVQTSTHLPRMSTPQFPHTQTTPSQSSSTHSNPPLRLALPILWLRIHRAKLTRHRVSECRTIHDVRQSAKTFMHPMWRRRSSLSSTSPELFLAIAYPGWSLPISLKQSVLVVFSLAPVTVLRFESYLE